MRTEPIRIETDRVKKVRKHVESTRQTISGFIAIAIDEKMERELQLKTPESILRSQVFDELNKLPLFGVGVK